jgi:hypothetical protein
VRKGKYSSIDMRLRPDGFIDLMRSWPDHAARYRLVIKVEIVASRPNAAVDAREAKASFMALMIELGEKPGGNVPCRIIFCFPDVITAPTSLFSMYQKKGPLKRSTASVLSRCRQLRLLSGRRRTGPVTGPSVTVL